MAHNLESYDDLESLKKMLVPDYALVAGKVYIIIASINLISYLFQNKLTAGIISFTINLLLGIALLKGSDIIITAVKWITLIAFTIIPIYAFLAVLAVIIKGINLKTGAHILSFILSIIELYGWYIIFFRKSDSSWLKKASYIVVLSTIINKAAIIFKG